MSLHWDLSDDFLIVELGDVFGEGGYRPEVAASSCSVKGRYCQRDLVWRGTLIDLSQYAVSRISSAQCRLGKVFQD